MKRLFLLASLALCLASLNSCSMASGMLRSVGRLFESVTRTVGG